MVVNKGLFFIVLIISFIVVLFVWVVIFFDDGMVFVDINVGLFYVFVVFLFGVYGIVFVGWVLNLKYLFFLVIWVVV